MFGKRKESEIVLSKINMFVFFLAQRVIEFVWQDKRPEIIQATIFIKEKESDSSGPLYKCEFSASVVNDGVLVEVQVKFDLSHLDHVPTGRAHGWAPVNFITFEIRSIRALKNVNVRFDIHATWRDNPVVLCDTMNESPESLRKIWAELGFETNVPVRTYRNES